MNEFRPAINTQQNRIKFQERKYQVTTIKSKRKAKKSKDIKYGTTANFDGVLLPIQNREDWGSYRPILKATHDQLKNMLSHHCKILALRVDFHVNKDHWKEGDFSKLLKNSKRKICNHYKLKRIAHIWAREASSNGSHHYHLVLIVDANKVNNPMVITNILTQEWIKMGHPHPRRNNHHILSSTVDNHFLDAFHHFSYLAKIHTKDLQPANARNVGSSNVKLNNKRLARVA